MLQLIPGWSHILGKKTCRPRRRSASADVRYRRAGFETLEHRRLLAINYVNVANSLDTQLLSMQGRITTALNAFQSGVTSKIPIVGDKLGNAAQVVSQFNNQLR